METKDMEDIYLSCLLAKALEYISYIGCEGILNIYRLYPDDPIVQSGWFEKFTDDTGFLDIELNFEDAILYARSIDDLPPKLKAFVIALKEEYGDLI